jgi:TP901 family phage tail tape measure protein
MGRGADVVINFITRGTEQAKMSMNKLSGSLGGMSKFAKQAAVAVGVALAVALRKAFTEFVAFDDAMTQSLAIMKTTVQQQEDMTRAAREVATQFRVTAKDAGESFFFLASAGLDAEQSIAALPQVTKFAQAGMFDMATATDLATDAQSALGLTVNDAQKNLENLTRVTDVLVKANQLANASVQQFSEALTTKSGAALKVVNKDIEEGVAVLAAFADRGVKGAEAGDKLNQVLRDIPRATAKNSEEFAKLGLEMFDAQGNMKNVADIIENLDAVLKPMSDEMKAATLDQLGLNRGVADAVKILSGATEQIREYEAALRASGGATEQVAENQMESLQAKIEIMNSNFTELGLVIMEKAAPAIEWIVEKTTALLKILTNTIETTEEEAEAMDNAAAKSYLYGDSIDSLHGSFTKYDEVVKTATKDQDYFDDTLERTRMSWLSSKDAQEDARTEVEEYNATVGNTNEVLNENIEALEEQRKAQEAAAEEMRANALPNIMAVIDAQQNLSDIYKEQDRLLEKREDASIDVAKAQQKEKEAVDKLEKAKQHLQDVTGLGAKVTDEEALAIARQEERVKELIATEDKSEIQKLELAVAQNKLNELREESTALSREEEQAIRDVENAEDKLKSAQEKVLDTQEKLNEATKEYNDATAKTPENLIEIAMAKKALDEALENQKAMGTFTEAINQMVEMGLGKFNDLRQGYMNMLNGVDAFKGTSSQLSGGTDDTGSQMFDTEGALVPDPEKAISQSQLDFDARNRTHVPSGAKTTINLQMTGVAMTQAEVTESVAEVIRRARSEGLDIG